MDSQVFDDSVIEVAAPISHSNLAAILISTLAIIAICVYVALVIWRKRLEWVFFSLINWNFIWF